MKTTHEGHGIIATLEEYAGDDLNGIQVVFTNNLGQLISSVTCYKEDDGYVTEVGNMGPEVPFSTVVVNDEEIYTKLPAVRAGG